MFKICLILLFNLQLLFSVNDKPDLSEKTVIHLPIQDTVLKTGWYNVSDFPEDNYPFMHIDKATGQNDNYFVIPKPLITLKNFKHSTLITGPTPTLIIQFDPEGIALWTKLTEQNLRGTIVFILDNKLIQVIRIWEKNTTGTIEINRPEYSLEELKKFRSIIEKESKQK